MGTAQLCPSKADSVNYKADELVSNLCTPLSVTRSLSTDGWLVALKSVLAGEYNNTGRGRQNRWIILDRSRSLPHPSDPEPLTKVPRTRLASWLRSILSLFRLSRTKHN